MSAAPRTRVGVVGATGYVGAELCRWVLASPHLELAAVTSRSAAGQPLAQAVPALLGLTDLQLRTVDTLGDVDAVFLATPHGVASSLVGQLEHVPMIVDCSRDHRHAPGWVYGQPEWHGEALAGATRIAAPGCFATAIAMALAPLAAAGVVAGPVQVVAATGSTGSGATASSTTHHPARFANLKAYKVLKHQHVPEIETFLAGLGQAVQLQFVPLSAPVDRGILATAFVPVGDVNAASLVADAYAAHPLVRLRPETPELRLVRGTAFCDLSVHQQGDTAVVIAAIDNLGRGAASQAVMALLAALGHAPHDGLLTAGCTP